ncbi:MAG: hypothetical protein KGL39_38830 [Patescibacteria group bacterium]|nr:hypothetical protein [Patescibacteria group bacterium]
MEQPEAEKVLRLLGWFKADSVWHFPTTNRVYTFEEAVEEVGLIVPK